MTGLRLPNNLTCLTHRVLKSAVSVDQTLPLGTGVSRRNTTEVMGVHEGQCGVSAIAWILGICADIPAPESTFTILIKITLVVLFTCLITIFSFSDVTFKADSVARFGFIKGRSIGAFNNKCKASASITLLYLLAMSSRWQTTIFFA